MKRMKHRIKREPESSRQEDHDLAYYIHDRVELMHQVFSVLKSKELRAMAPLCVRDISIKDLQELCTEELLGISSKRLCAILDGADPPSNTESSDSSPERMETISLDSISSDEAILSQASPRKSKKHKRHSKSKSKHKRRQSEAGADDPSEGQASRAGRAGLTVLELLELQARARAIRAQLQQAHSELPVMSSERVESSDDDEVVIKEEEPDVVEISSDEDKPNRDELDKQIENNQNTQEGAISVTKKINDLIITVPQTKQTKKIKLNRQRTVNINRQVAKTSKDKEANINVLNVNNGSKSRTKTKKKQKKINKNNKDGSDHDEIMLQLSDTEKMDLLEDLEQKSSEDSDSSSGTTTSDSDSENDDSVTNKEDKDTSDDSKENNKNSSKNIHENDTMAIQENRDSQSKNENVNIDVEVFKEIPHSSEDKVNNIQSTKLIMGITENKDDIEKYTHFSAGVESVDLNTDEEKVESKAEHNTILKNTEIESVRDEIDQNINAMELDKSPNEKESETQKTITQTETIEEGEIKDENKELSEGEVSQESVEVKALPDVDSNNDKKKKRKDKKTKKSKKNKKADFRESADQNFYKDYNTGNIIASLRSGDETETKLLKTDMQCISYKETDAKDDDVIEYLELSDDSSCHEVEGVSVLSKEPTAEEIAALSAKMDEIEREEVVNESEIALCDTNEIANTTWKDRYLESTKVKKVLNTSNILNAIRKKNIELKRKMEESKKQHIEDTEKPAEEIPPSDIIEGSLDHYNTLEGSTKFVDPAREEKNVSKEMKSDAKMLLKMYRKLLKYNDMNRKKDPKKKKKKNKTKEKSKDST
ncbi:dentin sialophosphoprotein [Leptidea sinapis]|uniref:dentin sialophosphoprotein n=1 Tax=Leptidea sinapis TaxID=189913 RepID=UPI00211FBB36|nr:dentin sialophosphoprotein [Leptidea sinapis]